MHEESPLWEAIELWGKLTGVTSERMASGGVRKWGEWEVERTYRALKEALELDPTEITATLLFKVFIQNWMKEATTSMQAMLDDPQKVMDQLTTAKKLLAIVDRAEIVQAREAFVERLRQGLARTGAADRADVQKLLDKPDVIAVLRRDALRSLSKLRVDQFLDGQGEDPSVQPVYVETIRQFWNINSFLGKMTSTPSGVCLAMIRDPFIYDTFFAFAIRNGANLFVLSDVPEHAHPLASKMARKPDRDMDQRISRNWYPYDLLGVEWDDEGNLAFARESASKGVSVYDEDGVMTKKIGEVGPHETIWLTMMLDLIVLKFWKQGFKAPQLSYTGDMIRPENAMGLLVRAAHLPTTNTQTLNLPALTVADIGPDAAHDEKALGETGGDHNKWLERRYAPMLKDEPLNLLGHAGDVLKITPSTGVVERVAAGEKDRLLKPFFDRDIQEAKKLAVIEPMRLTAFGSAEQLDADRKFLARVTYAKQLKALANEEFERRRTEVFGWVKARVLANKARLLEAATLGDVWVARGRNAERGPYSGAHGDEHHAGSEGERRVYSRFIAAYDTTVKSTTLSWSELSNRHAGLSLGGWEQRGRGELCAVNGAKASRNVIFSPHDADDLAWLCGVSRDELPDVLQFLDLKADHQGNHILTRIDPVSWMVSNPWMQLDYRVKVPLSLSGARKLQKLHPHPRPPEHLACFRKIGQGGQYEPLSA